MSVVRLEMRFVVAHNYTFKISPHLERREKVCVVSLCPSLLSCHARRIIYCICGLNSYLVQLSHDPNERRENGSNEWEFEGEDRPGLLTHTHSLTHIYEGENPGLLGFGSKENRVGDLIASPSRFRLLSVVGGFRLLLRLRFHLCGDSNSLPNGVSRAHRRFGRRTEAPKSTTNHARSNHSTEGK